MLVIDLLHEFELGVWKAIFAHLLRLLDSLKPSMVHEVDRRWGFLKWLRDFSFRWHHLAIVKCLRLAVIQFDTSAPILPRWKKWRPETLRICYWCGHFFRFILSLTVMSVLHSCLWETSAWASQYLGDDALVFIESLAWARQALHAHRRNSRADGVHNCNAGKPPPYIHEWNLLRFFY